MKAPNQRLATAVVLILAVAGLAQQVADPDFDPKVANPAYTKKHPKVFLDEAHNNFHTASGRYKPFADLISNDGYQVIPNKQKFSKAALKGCDVLVVSNALGAVAMGSPEASNSAFTEEECDAVRDWVRSGGNLLLIADHAPMGAANEKLGMRFGVEMSKGYTGDPANRDEETGSDTFLKYNRENKLLGDHPITRGRNAGETISRVIAFTGQSLKGPKDSVAFMKLADTAVNVIPERPGSAEQQSSAAGQAQGIAFKFGKGRAVVLAEAGMLSAQLAGPRKMKFGMNRPGIDNRQLALNIMHWLSGLLKVA
ncbi:MAG TPA: DUF4350 domain-containing protein [Blastocatellia bacterium]|nr:DUF4350 domain-containing protein [Blastocatellia bacterium]